MIVTASAQPASTGPRRSPGVTGPVQPQGAAVGHAGAPAAGKRPLGRPARTNELDAGKRRPAMGARKIPACWLWGCGAGSVGTAVLGWGRTWVSGVGLTSTHSAACRWPGAMTMPIRARAAQSNLRARAMARLRLIFELARAGRPLRGCHRVPAWATAAVAAGCGAAVRSASASRCQARVSNLRATAVVAIFFPRRFAMPW